AYEALFREFGIDPARPEETLAYLRGRPAAVREAVAMGLDKWVVLEFNEVYRRLKPKLDLPGVGPPAAAWEQMTGARGPTAAGGPRLRRAGALAPDSAWAPVRDALLQNDLGRVRAGVARLNPAAQAVPTCLLAGALLLGTEGTEPAAAWLRRAAAAH